MIICKSPVISYDLFQKLMVRGWWRTGNVFFRPQVDKICCPSFAIRMKVDDFQLSKPHRRTLEKWRDFLLNGDPRWENRNVTLSEKSIPAQHRHDNATGNTQLQYGLLETINGLTVTSNQNCVTTSSSIQENSSKGAAKYNDKSVKVTPYKGAGPDPDKPLCKKAKERRMEKRLAKQQVREGEKVKEAATKTAKTLLEVLNEHERELESAGDSAKHKLEMKLISQDSPEMLHSIRDFFSLYNRFQDAVHPGKSKFKTPADLHWGFIESPLEPSKETSRPLGTYHMRYYLDDELIMLSVLDILPEYLVSIYFIYDPHIRFLQPGIYTCLREIALIQQLQETRPELKYYNLGFYNDFSPKINYKRQFKPTEILCPITGTYVPLQDVIPLLKQNRFCRFAQDGVADRCEISDDDLDDLVVFVTHSDSRPAGYMYFHQLPRNKKLRLKPILRQYAREVGIDVLREMLLTQ